MFTRELNESTPRRLTLFRKIIAVYFNKIVLNTSVCYVGKTQSCNVNADGLYSYHCVLRCCNFKEGMINKYWND
jgi:hypothetical protein